MQKLCIIWSLQDIENWVYIQFLLVFPFSFQVKWNNDVIQYGGGPLGAPDSMGMVVAERSEVVQS